MSPIAPTLQSFFTDRLTTQRRVSARTIASYRDSLKLLLGFVKQRTGKAPSALDWEASSSYLRILVAQSMSVDCAAERSG